MSELAARKSKLELDYDGVLNRVRAYCRTKKGYEYIISEKIPVQDINGQTDRVRDLMTAEITLPPTTPRLTDIHDDIIGAKKGRILSKERLYTVKLWLMFYRRAQTLLRESEYDASMLSVTIDSHLRSALEVFCEEGINPGGDVKLKECMGTIQELKERRYIYAKKVLKKTPKLFRGDEPTLRNNRITLPVRSDASMQEPTIVTDSSDSLATKYREDENLIGFNNKVHIEDKRIEERMLELCVIASDVIARNCDELLQAEQELTRLDCLCAKACLLYTSDAADD